MTASRDHTELDAWKLADELWGRVRQVIARPGFRDDPELRSQLRRSARSPGPQIAEGFSRFYPKEFAPFLTMAKSSLSETIAHLAHARADDLLGEREYVELQTLARRARGATTQLLAYLESDRAARFNRPWAARTRGPRRSEPRNQPGEGTK